MFLSNLIIESTAPFVLISIGIRMRNSSKIQNRPIQADHRVDLGALYQCLRVLQVPFTVLFIVNRAMPRSQGSRSNFALSRNAFRKIWQFLIRNFKSGFKSKIILY